MSKANDLITPAFDAENDYTGNGSARLNRLIPNPNGGLTKREYFAAAALQGLSSNPDRTSNVHSLATGAVTLADALLAELGRREEAGK